MVFEKANSNNISELGSAPDLYTVPCYRIKGITEKLLIMMLSDTVKMGLDCLELKYTDDGYALYKKPGFKDTVSEYLDMKYTIDTGACLS